MNQRILTLRDALATHPPRIAYPEGTNPIILSAVRQLADWRAARPVLVADSPTAIKQTAADAGISLDGIEIMTVPHQHDTISANTADTPPLTPLTYAAQLLHDGTFDAMVAGIDHPTTAVLRAALKVVGLAPGVRYASSFFVMDLPHFAGGEDGLLIFADCGMNIAPDAAGLAAIAEASALSATRLGWQPRVALLSYSTLGSAGGQSVETIRRALAEVQAHQPELLIDGELQLDAALVPAIGHKKAPASPVAGQANVLVFPDLNSGNIAYKLAEHLAGGHAYGPILQGFARPISDLSRGSSVDDVIGASLIVGSMAAE